VYENRMLKRIFGPKRDEVPGGCRRLHNEEFHDLYSSLNIIRMMKSTRLRWAGNATCMGKMRNAYKFLVEKPEWKRPLGRPSHRS
jgi:hypothetical protein